MSTPKISDAALAAEVDEIREFEARTIAPVMADFPLFLRPKSTSGLTRIGACGLYCRAVDVCDYRARMRLIVNLRWEFRRTRLAGWFASTLLDHSLDEAAALEACALNFHDDRGDDLLHVPAFRKRDVGEAWKRAAAALGIETRCRACVC